MSDFLPTYLHDHLSGSDFAIELLEFLRTRNSGEPLARFAADLLVGIEADRKVLESLITRVGGHGSMLKESATWLAEKASRLKLGDGAFGTFEALEALGLGILGKLALWRALEKIADDEPRVSGVDYKGLALRAQAQQAQVEERRLEWAREVFTEPRPHAEAK